METTETEEKYARVCNVTGEGMNKGYCFGDGDFYCKTDESAGKHLRKILSEGALFDTENGLEGKELLGKTDAELLEISYENEYHYFTEWEVEEGENWHDADGKEFTTCHKCKNETIVQEEFNFCTHCLTHL